MELCFCLSICDLRPLNKVHKLSATYCDEIKYYGQPQGKQQIRNFSYSSISDLTGYESLHSLDISHCQQSLDVAHLKTLTYLNISNCKNITGYEELIPVIPHLIMEDVGAQDDMDGHRMEMKNAM